MESFGDAFGSKDVRTEVGGGVSQGAGWQRTVRSCPSPQPTSRTYKYIGLKITDKSDKVATHICTPWLYSLCAGC